MINSIDHSLASRTLLVFPILKIIHSEIYAGRTKLSAGITITERSIGETGHRINNFRTVTPNSLGITMILSKIDQK